MAPVRIKSACERSLKMRGPKDKGALAGKASPSLPHEIAKKPEVTAAFQARASRQRLNAGLSRLALAGCCSAMLALVVAAAGASGASAITKRAVTDLPPIVTNVDSVRKPDAWRQVGNPGQEGLAFLRTADFEHSDPRFAGLILRCNKNQRIEPVLVVVEPFTASAQPKITLRVAGIESYVVGTILPTGVGIRLPLDEREIMRGPWRDAQELAVTIREGETVIKGVVKLSGLSAAIAALQLECAQK
jgi:hypothetical protein